MNNSSQIATVKFTELKVSRQHKPRYAGTSCWVRVLLWVIHNTSTLASICLFNSADLPDMLMLAVENYLVAYLTLKM
jgi:hypothetical protein